MRKVLKPLFQTCVTVKSIEEIAVSPQATISIHQDIEMKGAPYYVHLKLLRNLFL